MSDPFTIPPPEFFHAEEVSGWVVVGHYLAGLAFVALVFGARAFG